MLADDTPPVDLAGYAAAGIARAEPWLTGWQGFKFDLSAILLPFMFVLSPALLLIDVTALELVRVIPTALLGVIALSGSIQGYLADRTRPHERLGLFAAALMLVSAEPVTDVVGAVLLGTIYWAQRQRVRAGAPPAMAS